MFPQVQRHPKGDLVVGRPSGGRGMLGGEVERQLLGYLILDSFRRQERSILARRFLPLSIEMRRQFFEQVRTRQLTAETHPKIERAGRVGVRMVSGSRPAHSPSDTVSAGIVSRYGDRSQTRARFIPKKHRRLRRNRDIQLFAVMQDGCRRQGQGLTELREAASSRVRRGYGIERDAVLCSAPDNMTARGRVSKSGRHRVVHGRERVQVPPVNLGRTRFRDERIDMEALAQCDLGIAARGRGSAGEQACETRRRGERHVNQDCAPHQAGSLLRLLK